MIGIRAICPPHGRLGRFACRLSRAAACLAIIFLVSACVPPGPASFAVATAPSSPSDAGWTARLEGVLKGQSNNDGSACFWVERDGTKTVLVWPANYSGRGMPLTIVDAKGNKLAGVGQYVILRGGLGPSGPLVGCSQASRVWIVAEVLQSR